jgi:photosystem II stability/assembly factor-like uncharacterized protein
MTGKREMKRTFSRRWVLTAAAVALVSVAAGVALRLQATESMPVSQLARETHIHGLAVDRRDPTFLLIATHHGLFRTGPDGQAERISAVQDFMGFNPHPRDPDTLFASGHPPEGGNLGFIASMDGGRSWTQISPGLNGPVDFHQMTVSPADPRTVYGAYGGIQVSHDGGKTWEMSGPAPARLIDLAASARSPDTLYAATEGGLLVSTDAGKSWKPVLEGAPVSLVEVTRQGIVYVFVLGRGLLRSAGQQIDFSTVNSDWGNRFLLHLAVDPTDPERLFAAMQHGQVLVSTDHGRSWAPFGK